MGMPLRRDYCRVPRSLAMTSLMVAMRYAGC